MLLPPNPVFRFYEGGDGIDELRGIAPGEGPGAPEDWVGSTTTTLGNDLEGLARLDDGTLLRDLITSDPVGFLGEEHARRFGADPGLLVKLLDAGERLAVHYHPGRPFAREHMGLRFGKTEAWIVLSAEPGAHMDLGLREPIDIATLERWIDEQDSGEMPAALHHVPVTAGDVLFVPAGTLHTIGTGITLIELQEPSDMSVVLEWKKYNVSGGEEHLHLGWESALQAVNTQPSEPIHGPARAATPTHSAIERLLPEVADPYFRAERVTAAGDELVASASFAVLIATDGEITVSPAQSAPLRLRRGEAALVPHSAGETGFSGNGSLIRCLPPAADSGAGQW
jgi:mannose-6-phosphate isomerase